MKKLTAILLALAVLAALCACGAAENAETTETAEAAETASAETAETAGAAAETEPAAEAPAENETGDDVLADGRTFDFYFEVNGMQIRVWDEAAPVIEALGDPIDTFEDANCAFQGSSLFYYYDGFTLELDTDEDDFQFIGSISIDDDTVKMPEGVTIAMPIDEALALLPEGAAVDGNIYSWSNEDDELVIETDADGKIESIQYMAIPGEAE